MGSVKIHYSRSTHALSGGLCLPMVTARDRDVPLGYVGEIPFEAVG